MEVERQKDGEACQPHPKNIVLRYASARSKSHERARWYELVGGTYICHGEGGGRHTERER